jgi:hypothetical protein
MIYSMNSGSSTLAWHEIFLTRRPEGSESMSVSEDATLLYIYARNISESIKRVVIKT